MPTYSFICRECGAQFERFASFSDKPGAQACPNGHSNTRRVYSAAPVVFKGSGFYSTDNRPKQSKSER